MVSVSKGHSIRLKIHLLVGVTIPKSCDPWNHVKGFHIVTSKNKRIPASNGRWLAKMNRRKRSAWLPLRYPPGLCSSDCEIPRKTAFTTIGFPDDLKNVVKSQTPKLASLAWDLIPLIQWTETVGLHSFHFPPSFLQTNIKIPEPPTESDFPLPRLRVLAGRGLFQISIN
jgi:hypothetical protein